MNFLKGAALIGCALFFGAGCRPSSTTPLTPVTVAPAPIHTDIAGLAQLVTLPFRPVSVTWQQTQIGDGNMGPSDSRLLAVMQFSPADTAKIELSARKHGKAQGRDDVEVQSWFPSPLRKNAVRGANKKLVLSGSKWKPDDFARMSLQNGSVMRVGKTNFFVLSLYTT